MSQANSQSIGQKHYSTSFRSLCSRSLVMLIELLLICAGISKLEAYVTCIDHSVPGGLVSCQQRWCKMYRSGEQTWYGCDDIGDCPRLLSIPIAGYKTFCSSLNSRQTCCCNYDFCNHSPKLTYFVTLLFILLLNVVIQ